MISEEEIVSENSNRDRDADVSLIINSPSPHRTLGNEESDLQLHSNELNRQNEDLNALKCFKQRICSFVSVVRDWWLCTSIITKVRLLGFVFLPCMAIGLYIFHFTQNPGTLHNPIAVLHPLSVVHPVIPSPFHSAVKFIEETSKDLLSNSADVTVTTNKGPIVGRRVDPNPTTGASYDAFLGVPYGLIPTRFQRAVPARSWSSTISAQSDGPPCPQPGVEFSEDCLFINVFTPKGATDSSSSYPVIAYIHGKDFTSGSSSSKHYGPDFLVPKGVILVTFNYRLGAAGFLTFGSREVPGNMGLYDTQLALHWIQNEISHFGGDPRKVTLMGHGAGSVIAMFHYLLPSSAGLFRYVIAQSGSALAGWGHYSGLEGASRAKSLAMIVGCDSLFNDTQILACLRKTNISYIVENQAVTISAHFKTSGQSMVFLPVIDTAFADKPFFSDSLANLLENASNRSKPLILGFTADEGIAKFAEDSCWKNVEANLDSFISTNIASTLSDRSKTKLVNSIRRHYFQNSITDSKIWDIVRLLQDHMMMYPILQVARKVANSSYGYEFNFNGPWTPDPPFISRFHVSGVNHGFDLRYLFYNSDDPQDLGNCSSLNESLKMRDMMINWWTNFVKTGTPGTDWPKISEGWYLKIASNVTPVDAATMENNHHFGFWDTLESTGEVSFATSEKFNFLLVICLAWWSILGTSSA